MTKKLKILSAVSVLCFLGSVACFSGYAAELVNNPSGEEFTAPAVDPGTTTYTDPGTTYADPGTTTYTDPGTTYADPGTTTYTDPGTTYVDPGTTTYTDPGTTTYTDPGTTASYYDPGTTTYTDPVYSNTTTTTDNNYQTYNYDSYSYYDTTSYYTNYTSQYNQYVTNTYQAQYDDNYYYVPSYTAPEESLIEVDSAQEVDTDELTQEDWHNIMLDLSDGNNVKESDTKTFNFIKENTEEGDTSVEWMLYLGIVLILMAVLTVIFVVITTNKASDKQMKLAV